MQQSIDTATATETTYDVPDADMFFTARRDGHAVLYAVDDHSDGKDNEFHTDVYYCKGNDVTHVNTTVDKACYNIALEDKVGGYEARARWAMWDVVDYYAEQQA
jgi:hypothetical protein